MFDTNDDLMFEKTIFHKFTVKISHDNHLKDIIKVTFVNNIFLIKKRKKTFSFFISISLNENNSNIRDFLLIKITTIMIDFC